MNWFRLRLPALPTWPTWIAVAFCIAQAVGGAESNSDFEAANKLFEQGRFLEAGAAYERLLTNTPTAALHFNLGNTRFKSGHPGDAIYHYHQALALAPRDPDARANLQFVRRSLGVAVDEPLARQWLRSCTLDEWAWLAGAGLGAWLVMLALGEALPARRATFAWLTRTLGLFALAASALLIAAHWERRVTRRAVVVTPEAPVRPGPLAESKPSFSLRDGSEVAILDAKDDWFHVNDGGRRSGWIRREGLRLLP